MTTRGTSDDLISRIEALEKALKDLTVAPVFTNASQRGGTFSLYPPTGNTPLEYTGAYADAAGAASYGHSFYDQNGAVIFSSTNAGPGVAGPVDHGNWSFPTQNLTTISAIAAFQTICEVDLAYLVHDVIFSTSALIVSAGATAQLRIYDAVTATQQGATLTVVGAASGAYALNWQHPYTVGWGDPRSRPPNGLVQIQARMSAGAGTITVYPPRSLRMLSSRQSTGWSSSTPLAFA